jgi:AraC family transcriptional regulator of adaptative response / DNA-3-methyladenine glycosylase II
MPLIARLRRLFDLDAEPTVVDNHLEEGGLGALVAKRPGVRLPGVFDGFEIAFRALLGGSGRSGNIAKALPGRIAQALGEPIKTGIPELTHLAPTAKDILQAGGERLTSLGVPPDRSACIIRLAQALESGALRLEPGGDPDATRRDLLEIDGISERLATTILMRTLYWPDAFPDSDRALQRAAGVATASALRARAERWRPWRAYAAVQPLAGSCGRLTPFDFLACRTKSR